MSLETRLVALISAIGADIKAIYAGLAAKFGQGTDIPTAADLNTYTTTGWYHQNTNANAAAGTNYPEASAGLLKVYTDGSMVYQDYWVFGTSKVYTRGKYNTTWSSWSQLARTSDNVATATALQTARAINGTNFDGSAAVTTANWGTARTITMGATGKSVNGSANVSWTLAEIGAADASATVNLTGDQSVGGDKTFTGKLLLADGTVALPSYTFSADPDTGIYRVGTNSLGITTGGTLAASFDASGNTNIAGGIGVRSGSPSASSSITASYTKGHGNGTSYGISNTLTIDNTSGALTSDRAGYASYNFCEAQVQNAAAFSFNAYGSYNYARTSTAGGSSVANEGQLWGTYNYALHQSNDATYNQVENMFGDYSNCNVSGATAYADNVYGSYNIVRPTNAGATINNGYLFYGTISTVTGTFNNRWGVYIASAINNYFAGGMQIGGTATGSTSAAGLGVGTAPSGTAGEIRATNNITAYYSSDRRLKENIRDIDGAVARVSYVGGKFFDWTDDYIKSHGGEDGYFVRKADFGVIAQDVQEVFPQAVREREDGTLAVDYEKLSALAFAAIKELAARVEKLEAR